MNNSNYIDEFHNSGAASAIVAALGRYDGRKLNIMEVCGTHTMSIFRHGIRELLPESVNLISGPGCPVCVTPVSFMDLAVLLAREKDVIIATFGDLLRVPGSLTSLAEEKADGADIRIVYSPLDALKTARGNPEKRVVFLSVGFETTTPVIALAVLKAYEENLPNFSILAANKTMPEALKILAADSGSRIDGFLYPGHVSAVTGTQFYRELAEAYRVPGVVAGFEPLDILHGIYTLTRLCSEDGNSVVNEYSRVVREQGNPIALEKMKEVFEPCSAIWRGLGKIEGSGLGVREKYGRFDARRVFGLVETAGKEPKGCICGEVLKGKATPDKCGLFGKTCTPESPAGACMVSSEGTCAAYFRYNKGVII